METPKSRVFECPPPAPESLPMNTPLCVGFGEVTVTKDGKQVWQGDDELTRLHRFELMAQTEPGVWTVHFYAPLSASLYRRTGLNEWVLVQTGQGFA